MNSLQIFKYRFLIPIGVAIVKLLLGSRSKESSASDIFFIVGSGRNGSTLLSAILNNNPQLFIPPEQYVLPFYASKWQLLRHKSKSRILSDMTKNFLQKNKTVNWQLTKEDYEMVGSRSKLLSFSDITKEIFSTYAQKIGKKEVLLFGEKSPLTTHYIHLFENEFKESKFIFLIRDPRDVIYSFSKVPGHRANELNYAIWKWRDSVIQYNRLVKKGKKVMLVEYEDLVRNPEKIINGVHDFLQIKYSADLLNNQYDAQIMGVSSLIHHQNLGKPITPESIGKWRGNLSGSDLSKIQEELGSLAQEFNYDLFD